MTGQTTEIRLKLLKMQGLGFSKAETVKQLTETFNITRGGAYYHFETLSKWASQYLDFENVKDFQFNILNQLSTINREASFQYLQAKEDNARIGYLRVRLEALSKLAEFLPEGAKTPSDVPVKWEDQPFLDLNLLTPEEKQILFRAEEIIRTAQKRTNEKPRESIY